MRKGEGGMGIGKGKMTGRGSRGETELKTERGRKRRREREGREGEGIAGEKNMYVPRMQFLDTCYFVKLFHIVAAIASTIKLNLF